MPVVKLAVLRWVYTVKVTVLLHVMKLKGGMMDEGVQGKEMRRERS